MFHEKRFPAIQRLPRESGPERKAVDGQDVVAFVSLWVVGAREVEDGGHDVDQLGRFPVPILPCLDALGPMHEEGGGGSPFVDEVLVETEGRVAGVGPGFTVAVGVLLVAFLDIVEVAPSQHPAFLAAPVIGEKEYQRVVEGLRFLEVGHEFPYVLVHPVDHGCVDRHLEIHFILLLLIQRIPVRNARGAGRKSPVRADQAGLDLPIEPLLPQLVPTDLVFSTVLRDVVLEGLQGPVRGGVGKIKKGRALLACLLLLEKTDGVIGEGIGGVEGFVRRAFRIGQLLVPERNVTRTDGVKEAGGPRNAAIVFLETPLEGPAVPRIVAQVPLASHQCCVVMALEGFRYGDAPAVEIALVGGWSPFSPVASRGLGHMPDADLVRMEPGHQGGPGGAASSAVVELGEAHASLGQSVEVRGVDFPAMVTEVGKAHVVHHDENDVGTLGGDGTVRPKGTNE